ncbi:MAG: hypothetical protein ABI811_01895 [Acidobacteriota bacterium]
MCIRLRQRQRFPHRVDRLRIGRKKLQPMQWCGLNHSRDQIGGGGGGTCQLLAGVKTCSKNFSKPPGVNVM